MSDPTEEKTARDKKAIEAMRGAQSTMKIALERINTLEMALATAAKALDKCKSYVGSGAYTYATNPQKPVHSEISEAAESARRVL